MAGQVERRALRDYVIPSLIRATSCIIPPMIQVNYFELKPRLIQMVQNICQFGGFPNDDPNEHIVSFHEICDTQRINGVSMEVIKLKLFPFSLKDDAKTWFNSLSKSTIAIWDYMATDSSPHTFHRQNQQKFEVISQLLPNLILNLFMVLEKDTRD